MHHIRPRARELPSHTVWHLVWQEGEVLPSVTFKTRVRTDEEGDNPFVGVARLQCCAGIGTGEDTRGVWSSLSCSLVVRCPCQ